MRIKKLDEQLKKSQDRPRDYQKDLYNLLALISADTELCGDKLDTHYSIFAYNCLKLLQAAQGNQ
jgi:hypothetical protein